MRLQLKIISGPQAGKTFPLRPGLSVGRADSDITLTDPKVSGRHAKIEFSKDKVLTITDLGSTNGIRVKGKRVTTATLTLGAVLRIGHTECIVEEIDPNQEPTDAQHKDPIKIAEKESNSPPIPPKSRHKIELVPVVPLRSEPNQTPSEASSLGEQSWNSYLSQFCLKATSKVKSAPRSLEPFKPMIKLTAIKGFQLGQSWVLGYGPRNIGTASLDCIVMDEEYSEHLFTLSPDGSRVKFYTKTPDQIYLNGQSISSDLVKEGDVIEYKGTLLKVSFIE